MLSKVSVTPAIERNVIIAFRTLHERGIYHGDVRGPNILVRDDNSVVVLDFERSFSNADRMMLLEEEDEVRHMLQAMRDRER
jgi:RIO-like serine/threonine protein kinase